MSQPYTPIDASQYTQNVMTQEEALSLADQILNPRYQQYLDQAATEAAQNLERAGIYNSVYGQNLLMSWNKTKSTQKDRRQSTNWRFL